MVNSEQIRNRIVELVKNNEFDKSDLLQVFLQLVHEGILENKDIIKIVKYFMDDILNAQTKVSRTKLINPRTGKEYSYNSHIYTKEDKFEIKGIEFITHNK